MRKIVIITCFLLVSVSGSAQWIFGKNPYRNQQDWDEQRIHWGYTIGLNSYDFNFKYNEDYLKNRGSQEILTETSFGFSVGLVGNLRLMEGLDLRFEPNLQYNKRDLFFPHIIDPGRARREVSTTYLHFPLLLKYSAVRTGNIRPFILAGISQNINLSSNEDSKEDNYEGTFRMKRLTNNYELGVGIDFYFPHFKLSTSLRGSFGIQDELIRDYNESSPWTGHTESMKTHAVFINLTFH